MAYITIDYLEPLNGALLVGKLRECNPTEAIEPAPFYVEDVLILLNQPGLLQMKKYMGKFWGVTRQVWVGVSTLHQTVTDADILPIVALSCPPYYPPVTRQEVDLSGRAQPEENWPPPPFTLD